MYYCTFKNTLCQCVDCAAQFLINGTTKQSENLSLLGCDAVSLVNGSQHSSASWYLHLQVLSSQRSIVNTGESMAIYRCSGNISSWEGGRTGWGCASVFLKREPLHTKSCHICHHM
jgi:hypothetical protein